MKAVLVSLLICTGITVSGQSFIHEKSQIVFANHPFETAKQLSVRVGIGVQKSLTTALGFALHTCRYGDVGFFSNDYYGAFEWVPNSIQNLYGFKLGYEANTFIFLLNAGLELKYQTDFTEHDLIIMPKIGFGLFGDINLFYGYSISLNKYPFAAQVSRHQVALVFNFNNHFLRYL